MRTWEQFFKQAWTIPDEDEGIRRETALQKAYNAPVRAFVVFSGETDLLMLRLFLKRGFRHCFLVLHDGKHWLSIDPLASHMEVKAYHHLPEDMDLAGWLQGRGYTVIEAPIFTQNTKAGLTWMCCVEVVKRCLGLRAFGVWTPWQLYRHLSRLEKERAACGRCEKCAWEYKNKNIPPLEDRVNDRLRQIRGHLHEDEFYALWNAWQDRPDDWKDLDDNPPVDGRMVMVYGAVGVRFGRINKAGQWVGAMGRPIQKPRKWREVPEGPKDV